MAASIRKHLAGGAPLAQIPLDVGGTPFARAVWNRGYATEAAGAWLETAFADRGLDRVVALAFRANRASTRVMEKIGMTFEVVVENGGDFVEAGIEVTFTYTSPSNETGTPQKKPIDEISPGQTNRQTLAFELGSQAYLLGVSTIAVEVSTVPDEKTTENNKATYPVEFALQ